MNQIASLLDGYRAFRSQTYPANRALFRELVERGQSPRVMLVACCDSRVAPTTVFNARPGELFVVRNVANLVPPHDPDGDNQSVSAALEFAVLGLNVEHIVVLGHAGCGGVKAFLAGLQDSDPDPTFVAKWVSLLAPAHARIARDLEGQDPADRQRTMEQAAIITSLDNLRTFPFVEERVAQGTIAVQGAYFDVATGRLSVYDAGRGEFLQVDDEPG